MPEQIDFLAAHPEVPQGFRYQRELIDAAFEVELLGRIRELPFRAFEFHGFVGNRRMVSFGSSYDFAREALGNAEPLPSFLKPLRDVAARFAGATAESLVQTLVTEYGPGAAIGWHRDKGVFGDVIGVSLMSTCRFRLRRRAGAKWERVAIDAEPRSAYVLSGAARTEWEHSIPPVETTRYSVTFRTLRSTGR